MAEAWHCLVAFGHIPTAWSSTLKDDIFKGLISVHVIHKLRSKFFAGLFLYSKIAGLHKI